MEKELFLMMAEFMPDETAVEALRDECIEYLAADPTARSLESIAPAAMLICQKYAASMVGGFKKLGEQMNEISGLRKIIKHTKNNS